MTRTCFAATTPDSLGITALTPAEAEAHVDSLPAGQAAFARAAKFSGKPGQTVLLPADTGVGGVLVGVGDESDPMVFRVLALSLPEGVYHLAQLPAGMNADLVGLAWALGGYQFTRYRQADRAPARLVLPDGADADQVQLTAEASVLARDLVNTPAMDMGPIELADTIKTMGKTHKAKVTEVTGPALAKDYPLVHAVGMGAERAPRLVELSWGKSGPHIAVVGKGVVFDTGGLDMKPSAGMRLMKKDMGGAAHAIALAQMIMAANLKVRLTLLVPTVENAVSGKAFRPSDVITSRKGLTVEIDNTDAEGRLILADALTRAEELKPDLTLDFATLTGAARVALGPDVIPFYTAQDDVAAELMTSASAVADPLWRMPLWSGYKNTLDSPIADICNMAGAGVQAGSVMAALFLQRFAPKAWVHFDIYAWNPRGRPGYPVGAEFQAVRAAFEMIKARAR